MKRSAVAAVVAVFALQGGLIGWSFYAARRLPGGWGGTPWIWGAMIGGAIVVGLLTAVLMWLAFYSARKGYDDAAAECADDAEF
jgi:cation transporter-like permease